MVFVIGLILSKSNLPYTFSFTSAEKFGESIGTIIAYYLIIAFFVYYISFAIAGFRKKKPERIRFVTVPGFLFGILLLVLYIYRAILITDSLEDIDIYSITYTILAAILIYFTIIDFKTLRAVAKSKDL